jgi:protein-S-isoprenylcysteine O-methyltransferase Ste14
MRREESELLQQHGAAFQAYAAAVPLFLPRFAAAKLPGAAAGKFSYAQYKKNHEYQAAMGFLLLLIGLLAIWWLRLRYG